MPSKRNDYDAALEVRAERAREYAAAAAATLEERNGGAHPPPSMLAAAAALELAMLLLASNTCRGTLRGRLDDPALRDALHTYDRLTVLFRAAIRHAGNA